MVVILGFEPCTKLDERNYLFLCYGFVVFDNQSLVEPPLVTENKCHIQTIVRLTHGQLINITFDYCTKFIIIYVNSEKTTTYI